MSDIREISHDELSEQEKKPLEPPTTDQKAEATKEGATKAMINSAESILDFMKNEIKKWNGWTCLSISRPGSGRMLQKKYMTEMLKGMKIPQDKIDEELAKAEKDWDDTLVPVQVHKQVPALNDGLYEAIDNRLVCWVKITNTEFGGLVCDRGFTFCVGDPFAMSSAFPNVVDETEQTKVTKVDVK